MLTALLSSIVFFLSSFSASVFAHACKNVTFYPIFDDVRFGTWNLTTNTSIVGNNWMFPNYTENLGTDYYYHWRTWGYPLGTWDVARAILCDSTFYTRQIFSIPNNTLDLALLYNAANGLVRTTCYLNGNLIIANGVWGAPQVKVDASYWKIGENLLACKFDGWYCDYSGINWVSINSTLKVCCGNNFCDYAIGGIEYQKAGRGLTVPFENSDSCPQDCPKCFDNITCTSDTFDYAQQKCVFPAITQCIGGDGCCPQGCTGLDYDCEPVCGNGICQSDYNYENCNNCTADCACQSGYKCMRLPGSFYICQPLNTTIDCNCPLDYDCELYHQNVTGELKYKCTPTNVSQTTTTTIPTPTTTQPSTTTTTILTTTTTTIQNQTALTTTTAPTTTNVAPPSCPSSCDDGNPCSVDYCSSLTDYQCRHDMIPDCSAPSTTQNATVETANVTKPIAAKPIVLNVSILQTPPTVSLTIDKNIGLLDLMKVKVDVSQVAAIANSTVPLGKISDIKITKSGENVVYSIGTTRKEKFLFIIDVDVPQNVTIDVATGNLVNIEKKTAFDVVIEKIVKTILFWMK